MSCSQIKITVFGDGCGLEVDGSTVYSIGNQTIGCTVTDNSCDCAGSPIEQFVLINDATPPVEVCDGDTITVSLSPGADCACPVGMPTVECTGETPLFVVSKLVNGKIKLILSNNENYKKLKATKAIQQMYQLKAASKVNFWIDEQEKPIEELLTMYVLHNEQSLLDNIEDKPYIQKINLSDLQLGSLQNNSLCENRFYLSKIWEECTTEYIGIGSAKWNIKYPNITPIDKLHNITSRLAYNVVFGANTNNIDWLFISEYNHPGIQKYIEEACSLSNLQIKTNKIFWANNFICHIDIFKEFMNTWQKWFDHFYNKYKFNYKFSNHKKLAPAFLFERFTILYFSNRSDLKIEQI